MTDITPQAAITAFNEATQKLAEAETSQSNAQDQFDAAFNAKKTADANAAAAVVTFNTAIDNAVAALSAAKRVPAPAPAAKAAA